MTDASDAGRESHHTMVFLGGVHRSGTSLLFELLRDHPEISGFRGTGVREDEGQHLQSTYPAARAHGGAGRFGFDPAAHLVEVDEATATEHRLQLMRQWSPWWDLRRPVLLEKSPPNLIRMRYLQAVFPGARFVVIVRHPVAVALATKKWRRRQSTWSLMRHWFVCHDVATADAAAVEHLLVLRYEELLREPAAEIARVLRFVGVAPLPGDRTSGVTRTASDRYRAEWAGMRRHPVKDLYVRALVRRFGDDASRYGYRLDDLEALLPWQMGEAAASID